MSGTDMLRALSGPYERPAGLPPFDQPAANAEGLRRFYWAKEARSFAPPEWLIPGLIQQGTIVLLFGESSSGKSTVAVDFGMRITTGMAIQNEACRKGAVMHVAGEDELGLRQRVEAFRSRYGVDDPPYGIRSGRLNLADEASVDALIHDIKAAEGERGEPVVLVIIDTLARCARIEENSSSEMSEVVAACDRIKDDTGATVMIIHHTGKEAKKGARGSSALRAAVDSEIEVRTKDDSRGLWVTKQRNGRAQYGWQFKLEEIEIWRDASTGRTETACTVEHGEKTDKLFAGRANWGPKKLGKNQQKLREALEKEYRAGVDCWDADRVRHLARDTLSEATRSSVQSAVAGMTKRGVLVESVEGRLYLTKPPARAPLPARVEADEAQPERRVEA